MNNLQNLNIIALIPARSGSKGIPHKNIKLYKGIPLMAHSIILAKKCKYINNVYVSTDSQQYANIATEYGAEVPFLRPVELSDDLSPDYDCFKHFLEWMIHHKQVLPDIIIHLRPTYPNRTIHLLNLSIELFINEYNNYDSLRSVVPYKKTPFKMYHINYDSNNNNLLIPFLKDDPYHRFVEPYNQARQNFPETFLHNGCIDIVKSSVILNNNLLSGSRIFPFIMDEDETNDIDDLDDFSKSEKANKRPCS